MMQRLVGRDPRTGSGFAVSFANGIIQSVEPDAYDGPSYLAAGLVDLQINGYSGIDLNDHQVTPERVGTLSRKLFEKGVTSYLPTLITASETSIVSALAAIAEARRQDPILAHAIPGVHVEGPAISPEDGPRGAHPRDQVRAPDIAEIERWQAASDGLVRLVTFSPHWDNS